MSPPQPITSKSKTKRGRKRKFKTKEEENASHINQMNETLDKVRSRENAIPFIRLAFRSERYRIQKVVLGLRIQEKRREQAQ